MKILITGANGFVGENLIKSLEQERDLIVTAVARNPTSFKMQFPEIDVFQWNPQQNQIDPRALEGVDVVVHLAGENISSGRWTEKKKKNLLDSRINGVRLLMGEIKKSPRRPTKFISASAIGIYGNRGDEILQESSPEGQGFLAHLCHQWEHEVLSQNNENMKTYAVRFGIVLGKNGGALGKMTSVFKLGLGGPLGNGAQFMSWIHMDDLICILKKLILMDCEAGVYNATAPNPVTNQEFTKTLGSLLNRPAILPVPAFFLKMVFGEMSEILLNSQRVVPKRLLDEHFQFLFPDLKTALNSIL